MPFTKITRGKNKGKYESPSGRIWTPKQIEAYYASNGKFDKAKAKASKAKK